MDIDLRAETELRLLMTAAMTDNPEVRERILDYGFYTTSRAQKIQAAFVGVFLDNPTADYSVMMSSLPRSEQEALVGFTNNTLLSLTIEEYNVDNALENLRKTELDELIRRKVSELSISEKITTDDLRSLAEEIDDKKDARRNSKKAYIENYDTPVEVVPTGYPILDKMLGGGFVRGTVSALGARPSVGKTTLAVNIAAKNPQRKILFFSLEMSARMVYDKLISDVGDLDYSDCVKHKVNLETVKTLLQRYENLTVIDDVYEIEDIAAIIRREKPELVMIDYIQIVQTRENIEVVRQRIDRISQIIKRTAKSTGAHIMCLSQITRGAKEEPTMSALKESGGLEETGDYVILLKRPYVLNKADETLKPEETELKIDKNKFGESGLLQYYFRGNRQRFLEVGYANEKKTGHEEEERIARMKKEAANEQSRQEGLDGDLPF